MASSRFIQDLEIASLPGYERIALRDAGSGKGFVNAGSIVSFIDELLTPTHKSDVLNSTLLAQLAADFRYDRQDTDNWYKFYIYVLGKVGWNIQNIQFEQYRTSRQTLRVSNAILDIAKTMLTAEELVVVQKTIDGLNASDNEPCWVVFDKYSGGPSIHGNFQVAPCKKDSSGKVIMFLTSFYFTASSTKERWLWFDYDTGSMHLFRGTQVLTLNEDAYGQVRQEIIDKLGVVQTFIGDLDI